MKNNFTYKYIRPTDKEYGHTQVFLNGEYIGYMMQIRSKFAPVGHNWDFSPGGTTDGKYLVASNRNKLVQKIEETYSSKL